MHDDGAVRFDLTPPSEDQLSSRWQSLGRGAARAVRQWRGSAFSWVKGINGFFYRVPVEGVKSAQIEFYVNCDEGTLREGRYNDFNEQRLQVGSGDNFESNAFRRPRAGTVGEDIVRFSCADDLERSQRYAKVDDNVDLWALGENLLHERRSQQTL